MYIEISYSFASFSLICIILRNNYFKESNKQLRELEESRNKIHKLEETVIYNAQYRELIALINYQREKLSTQQADLTKVSKRTFRTYKKCLNQITSQYDAEIVYWEGKEREKQLQLEFIAQEMAGVSNTSRVNQEQVRKNVIVFLSF